MAFAAAKSLWFSIRAGGLMTARIGGTQARAAGQQALPPHLRLLGALGGPRWLYSSSGLRASPRVSGQGCPVARAPGLGRRPGGVGVMLTLPGTFLCADAAGDHRPGAQHRSAEAGHQGQGGASEGGSDPLIPALTSPQRGAVPRHCPVQVPAVAAAARTVLSRTGHRLPSTLAPRGLQWKHSGAHTRRCPHVLPPTQQD